MALSASVAWPCSGEVCNRDGELALVDGGLPANFPLILNDMWDPNWFVTDGFATVWRPLADAGIEELPVQLRRLDRATVAIDTSPLIEGERYWVARRSACALIPPDAGFVDQFVVGAPKAVLTQGVAIEVEDAGTGLVAQYSGASCSEGVPSSFVTFRFVVNPSAASELPFYGWKLALQPSSGGASIPWQSESVGVLLADGSLRQLPNPQLAWRRISTVFTACGGPQFSPGAPPGRYRAVLSARFATMDAGFDSTSDEFELLPCIDNGGDAGVIDPPDAGTDAGFTDFDGGSATNPDGGVYGGVLGPSANRGCSVSGGSTLLLFALLALRRRR